MSGLDEITPIQEELRRLEAERGAEHPDVAECLYRLSWAYGMEDRDREPHLRRAIRIWEESGAAEKELGDAYSQLGQCCGNQEKFGEAESAYLRALAIQSKMQGTDYGYSLHGLGVVYLDQGEIEKAERMFLKAFEVREKLPEDKVERAATRIHLGHCCLANGRAPEAEAHFRQAMLLLAPQESDDLMVYLVDALYPQGKLGGAEEHLVRALELREEHLGTAHADLVPILLRLATIRHNLQRYAEAEGPYRRCLEILEKTLGPDSPDLAPHLNNLGLLFRDQGRWEEAQPYFDRARRLQGEEPGA